MRVDVFSRYWGLYVQFGHVHWQHAGAAGDTTILDFQCHPFNTGTPLQLEILGGISAHVHHWDCWDTAHNNLHGISVPRHLRQ